MAPVFNIVEHVIPGQHIREYPNATKHRQEDVLQLSIKQYIPLNRPTYIPHDALTIIGAHGNGFPKVSCGLKSAENPMTENVHSQQGYGLNVALGDL